MQHLERIINLAYAAHQAGHLTKAANLINSFRGGGGGGNKGSGKGKAKNKKANAGRLGNLAQKKGKGFSLGHMSGNAKSKGIGAVTNDSAVDCGVKFMDAPRLGGGRGGLRMVCTVPIALISAGNAAASGTGALTDQTNTIQTTYQFSPITKANWLHFAVPLFARAFARYKLSGLGFKYRRVEATTNQSTGFIFAWSEDPFHPNLNSTPTVVKLRELEYQHEFAAYDNWDMAIPVDSQDLLFTYSNGTSDDATVRLDDAGCLSCLTEFVAGSGPTTYGTLYCECVLDFYEMSSYVTSISSSVSMRVSEKIAIAKARENSRRRKLDLPLLLESEEVKEDGRHTPDSHMSIVECPKELAPLVGGLSSLSLEKVPENPVPQSGHLGMRWF